MSEQLPQEPIRYKLTVSYRGTAYHGWQRQIIPGDDTGAMELPTVQNTLRLALQRVVGHPVTLTGASRTDAGVHAIGQKAMFDTIRHQILPEKLQLATNAKLPADVAVTGIEAVPGDFSVIGDTIEKGYRYSVHNGHDKDVFGGDLSLHVARPMLDAEAMQDAASRLVGSHDFAAFAKPGHGRESTVRTITSAMVERNGDLVTFNVSGTGFLWNQVRIMAGTLLRIGLGKRPPSDVDDVLASQDRQIAGPTAPAHGLCLMWIRHRD